MTDLHDMDTRRTVAYTLGEIRKVLAQVRLAQHYADCILTNPAADHEHVRAFLRDSVLHDMNLTQLSREAATLALTMEKAAKAGKP